MEKEMEIIDILLVEDNPDDIELTLRALEKNRLANNVHVVNDGEEALDFLRCRGKYEKRCKDTEDVFHRGPKVVILDLKLPKLSGIEVLKEIKSDKKLKIIPVVVLTSSREERDLVETYKLGVNSYIIKPVEFEDFVKAVSHMGLYWLLLNKSPVE